MRNPTVCRSIFDSSATELRRCPDNLLSIKTSFAEALSDEMRLIAKEIVINKYFKE